ncbi:peptide ABC transporter substrate-binding protein [Pseudooceanicola nanhaiensis]|uniref:peptide ABC transporter substrate-binding protein n=1 Tax=Pseudooceanicola nanhaiensis TaxID=375761 RepID=UPI001CD7D308|nr:peptide ABC transporter substrate-binding protein [Pseudooceanicola nanhaiensis]MCA0921405.1 peptide ABC transporter substrate-binding protein [Pseudooceanicola nanhaiensis]
MTDKKHGITRRGAIQMLGAGALLAPNLLGKPAFAQTPPEAPAGRIIVGQTQESTVLNPLLPHIEVDDAVIFSLFDALFRVTPGGEIMPNLASEVPTQENGGISADGLQWRIKLRDDVTWHDGEPFTAEDVKFTLELIVNPDFRAWRTIGHNLVKDIEVVSPTEITWTMEKPFAPYINFLTETFIIPAHAFEGVEDPNTAPFNSAPIGTGAFKFGQRVPGDHVQLVANPGYHAEGPYVEELIYKYIPDTTVLYTQFKSGEFDLTGNQYISPDNYAEAKDLADREVVLVPVNSVESIYLNQEKPQFKDPAVRKALYAAIDKVSIIDALYYGLPLPSETFMPQASYFYNPDLPTQEFDLAAANKMLDDAGWVRGADGIREKDGVRLSFTNSTTAGNHLREQVQQFLQQTFKEIGVEMEISNLPAAVIWGEFWGMSQFDSVIVGITFLIGADPDVTNRFHSAAIAAQGGRGSNNSQYKNARVDELLEEGSATFDPEKRRAIYQEIQAIIREDLPFLPLFQNRSVRGWKSGIEGVEFNTNTRTESWHAAAWYWDK